MNEVQEAIERITARLDLAAGFDDLPRRRDRTRARRRVAAGVTALALTAAGSFLVVRAFPGGGRAPTPLPTIVAATWPASDSATASPTAGGARSDCPTPSGDDRAWALSSTSGPAGSSVDVSGTFQNGQFWVQLWWNAGGDEVADKVGPPPWPPTGPDLRVGPAGPGPVVELAAVTGPASGGECSFHTRFTVPDVDSGTYQLVFVIGGMSAPPGDGGYAVFQSTPGSVTFQVSG